MSNSHQNSISWYSNVYYSYRDYPIKHLNIKYKKSQLKGIYNTLIKKMISNLQINIQSQEAFDRLNNENSPFSKKPIQQIISKLNKNTTESEINNQNSTVSLDNQSSPSSLMSIQEDRKVKQKGSAKKKSLTGRQSESSLQNVSIQGISSVQSIASYKNIKNSKDNINKIRQVSQSPKSFKKINDLHLLKICEQSINQQNKNMDVLYQLMIGMIRLTMKRTTVQIDQQIKMLKQNQKKFQIIDEQMEKSQNQDNDIDDQSSFKSISHQQSSGRNSSEDIKSNSSDLEGQSNTYNFVISYAASLGQARKKKQQKQQQKKQQKKRKFQSDKQCPLANLQYPSNVQELKFQFLKYCLKTNIPSSNNNQNGNRNSKNSQFGNRFSNDSQRKQKVLKKSQSIISEENQQNSVVNAKVKLQTYFTELTQMDEKQTKNIDPKQTVSQMETLVMKLANFQMKSFNLFVNHFFKKIEQASAIVNVIGLDAITQSMCQMALGKQARDNGIKTQVGLGNMQVRLFSNSVDQENSNILLSTWVDLVLFSEDPKTLYQITQNLNRQEKNLQEHQKKKKTWTPSINHTPASVIDLKCKQKTGILFKEKMLSLLNFLILNTTKNIFLQSITKANFLSVVILDILANRHDRRRLTEFQLRKLRDSELGQSIQVKQFKDLKFLLGQDQAIVVYDLTFEKQVWMKESLDMIFKKWKKVIQIIFEQQIKNPNLYWQLIFEKCVSLINRQLSLLTVLVFNLVEIIENINLHIQTALQNSKLSELNKREIENYEKIKNCIQFMIKELIGSCQLFGVEEGDFMMMGEQFMEGNISGFLNAKQFAKKDHAFKFINRQENAKQLIRWEDIIKQNILILENYINSIEQISSIFENKPYHTASWVVNFHKQTKILLKKVKKENITMFFQKFYEKIPKLWNNLNYQQKQQKTSGPVKRNGFIASKHRISSIKNQKQLSYTQKEALIINYMIKAELELYQSYTKSHVLNCRQQSSTMTTIVSGNSTFKSNRPFIFEDTIIQSLLIFNYKNPKKAKKDMVSSNLFSKRSPKAHFTLKPLSSFAPSPIYAPLSPRKSPKKQKIQPFKKKADVSLGVVKVKQNLLQISQYQIDVSLLQQINYTSQEINFLQQLNNHLKFINEINFQYEYYYWKNVTYEKKFSNKKDINFNQTQIQEDEKSQSSSAQFSQTKDKKMQIQLKKMVTFNEYTRQKIQNLLTTQQFFKELAQIGVAMPGIRSQFIDYPHHQRQLQIKLMRYHSVQIEDKQKARNLYKEKMEQIHQRIKIHNQSLTLIVKAGLQAKNYWKAVSSNVFPEDDILNSEQQQYIVKNQNKLQKSTQNQIQVHFQERFFEKKILQKLQQYINYYRDISKQMNYSIDSGMIPPENSQKNDEDSIHQQVEKRVKIKQDQNKIDNESQVQSVRSKQIKKGFNKKPSIFNSIQQSKQSKIRVYSLLQALICKKQQPKMNRFEIAAQIYQFSQKILKLNCYMSSFYVERKIYLDIISNQQLSQQRYLKVKIIGKQYFQRIKQYSSQIYQDREITQQNLKKVQLVYEKKILIILISLIQLLYYGNQHNKTVLGKWKSSGYSENRKKKSKFHTIKDLTEKQFQRGYKNHGFKLRKSTIKKYSELLKKFLKYRFKKNTNNIFSKEGLNNLYQSNEGDEQSKSDYFYISKLFSEAFQFSEVTEQYNEDKFIRMIRKLRNQENDDQFLKFYILIMEKESFFLDQFQNQQDKVNCLKKKFNYLILRQIYFFLYYDIDCLQEKSAYSKKNYQLYENRILDFYQQIIKKSYEDFMIKKQLELKKRSVYLQNYLLKYEDEPQLAKVQKNMNKLLVCVFNQIMLIYTQDIKLQIKKKCEQVQTLNHQMKKFGQPLHTHYLSSQFYQDKSLFKRKQTDQKQEFQEREDWNNGASNSNTAHILPENIQNSNSSMKLFNKIFSGLSKQRQSRILLNMSNIKYNEKKLIETNRLQTSQDQRQKHSKKASFKVFTIQSMNLHQAISLYQEVRQKNSVNLEKYLLNVKQSCVNVKSLKRDDLTQMQIRTLQTNEQSIVSLLKRQIIQKINQMKFHLVQKNLISRIQKLYINLDVRHKVFESFKDKILSYQMQKAKIYHQYMDYIRGLKLDVYSHIANQDSIPYIKIVNAIKFYRLQIKKQELQNKVRQQFGKNLQKWNHGIQQDLQNYNQWLNSQQNQWQRAKTSVHDDKNQLLIMYHSIKKQLKRQSKKKQQEEQAKLKKQLQNLKNVKKFNERNQFQKGVKQFKKISKKGLFLKHTNENRPQSLNNTQIVKVSQFKIQQNIPKTVKVLIPKEQDSEFADIILSKKHSQMIKSNSLHCFNQRSLSKYSVNEKIRQSRPTTSTHADQRLSTNQNGTKLKNFNRASTAVTRQKSIDIQNQQFRGIKMKYFSKSVQKFASCAQSTCKQNEMNVFKRSTESPMSYGDRILSGHITKPNFTSSNVHNYVPQNKSRTLLKQARYIVSAAQQRRGIIKNC